MFFNVFLYKFIKYINTLKCLINACVFKKYNFLRHTHFWFKPDKRHGFPTDLLPRTDPPAWPFRISASGPDLALALAQTWPIPY